MALSAGTRLGPYEIVSALGSGGMGDVYQAFDTKLQRTVAIKVLASADDDTSRARLLHEAQAASSLNHPNICTVHEIHDTGERAFIVMENVDGRPLSGLIPHDGLPLETFVRYAVQIADALEYAHQQGVVHRDLKPSNVVVSRDERPKVLDFGLAHRHAAVNVEDVTRSRTPTTGDKEIVGTLGYMAPELLRVASGDALSDIWALGVLLYKMLSGAMPFKGDTAFDLSAAILRDPPGSLPERVPLALRRIVARCLAKEPSHRYQRASEVRAALETFQTDSSPSARAATVAMQPEAAVVPEPPRFLLSPAPRRLAAIPKRFVGAAIGVVLAGTAVWGILGRLTDRAEGQGLLIRTTGTHAVRAGADGTLTRLTVKTGDLVTAGQIVGHISRIGSMPEYLTARQELDRATRDYETSKKQDDAAIRDGLSTVAALEVNKRQMELMLQRAREEVVRLRDTSANATVTKNNIDQAERARDGFEATLRASDAQIAGEKERVRSLAQRIRVGEKAVMDRRTALERLAAAGSSPVDLTTRADGRVAELRKRLGDVVRSDEILMIVEPLDTELTAVGFVDPGRPIRSGMEARVFPFTVDSEAFGYIVGTVAAVG